MGFLMLQSARRILRSPYAAIMSRQTAIVLCSLVSNGVLARTLSLRDFGLYVLMQTALPLVGLATLSSFHTSIQRAILSNRDDYARLIIRKSIWISIGISACGFVVAGIAKSLDASSELVFGALSIAFIAPALALEKYEAILQIKERFHLANSIGVWGAVAMMLATSMSALLTQDFMATLLAFSVSKLCQSIYGMKRASSFLQFNGGPSSRNESFDRQGAFQSVNGLISFFASRADRFVIGASDAGQLAIYYAAITLATRLKDHAKVLVTPLAMRWAKEGQTAFWNKIRHSTLATLGGGLVLSGLLALVSEPFIRLTFGARFLEGLELSQLYALTIAPVVWLTLVGHYDALMRRGKYFFAIDIVRKLSFAGGLLVLFRYYGLIGAVAASIFSDIVAVTLFLVSMRSTYRGEDSVRKPLAHQPKDLQNT